MINIQWLMVLYIWNIWTFSTQTITIQINYNLTLPNNCVFSGYFLKSYTQKYIICLFTKYRKLRVIGPQYFMIVI